MAEGVEAYFEDHKVSADLGRRALRGGLMAVAIQYGNGALQISTAIILARLLAPEDFGIVAIITVLTSFAPSLIDFGLGDVTAQRIKITHSQISSLFWLSIAIGLVVAIVVAACGPLIAAIYQDARLKPIALWTAVSFVAWGASNLHLALLRRAMRFGTIARIQVLATLAGSVIAILAAVEGYGYWALVLRPITTALCVASGAWIACCWRPGFPVVDDEVKSMVRFGLHVVGFSITYTLARAVDRIGLSLFYRPDVVGYYQNATTLYENSISLVLSQLNMVGSASLSKLQFDPAALRQKYEAALSALSFFLMPMAAILSVTGEDVTVSLLGQKWQPAGLLLSIIALRGIFQVIEGSQGWIHLSIGRADRWRKWGMVSLGVQIVALLAGLPFGAKGVAAAGVIASLLIAVPTITYAGRPIDIGSAVVMRAVGRQLIGAVSIVAAGWCVKTTLLAEYSSPVRILLSVAFCACLYLVIVVGIFRLAEPVKVANSVVRDLLRGR